VVHFWKALLFNGLNGIWRHASYHLLRIILPTSHITPYTTHAFYNSPKVFAKTLQSNAKDGHTPHNFANSCKTFASLANFEFVRNLAMFYSSLQELLKHLQNMCKALKIGKHLLGSTNAFVPRGPNKIMP